MLKKYLANYKNDILSFDIFQQYIQKVFGSKEQEDSLRWESCVELLLI